MIMFVSVLNMVHKVSHYISKLMRKATKEKFIKEKETFSYILLFLLSRVSSSIMKINGLLPNILNIN